MSIKYVDCSTTNNVYVNYRATDQWIFVPNYIYVTGKRIPVNVNVLPPGYDIINSDYNGFISLKHNGEISSANTLGACSQVGKTYPMNYTYPAFSLNLDISSLTSGNYTGTIPIKMAFAEYFGTKSSDITKFSDNLAFQYTSNSEIPYSINITNKCAVSPTKIELNHGELSVGVANGHSVSSNMTITCDEPASLKITVTSRSNPKTSYYDGVGVGLGNGWDSVLQIGNSGLSDYSLTKTILVSGKNASIPVSSTLKRTGTISAGNISGNMVLGLEID